MTFNHYPNEGDVSYANIVCAFTGGGRSLIEWGAGTAGQDLYLKWSGPLYELSALVGNSIHLYVHISLRRHRNNFLNINVVCMSRIHPYSMKFADISKILWICCCSLFLIISEQILYYQCVPTSEFWPSNFRLFQKQEGIPLHFIWYWCLRMHMTLAPRD